MRKTVFIVASSLLVLSLFSCGEGPGEVDRGLAIPVTVTLTSFNIASSQTEFTVGAFYSFNVTNNANITHEWMIMPRGVTDEAQALVLVEDITPGMTNSTIYSFTAPGEYEFACHLATHYQSGMKLNITVR